MPSPDSPASIEERRSDRVTSAVPTTTPKTQRSLSAVNASFPRATARAKVKRLDVELRWGETGQE